MALQLQPRVSSYLRNISGQNIRTFAAAATAQKSDSIDYSAFAYKSPREELRVSRVNNVTVATVETNMALSKIAVYLRAGSRFETDDTQGVTQMLRLCAGLGTQNNSHFSTTRTLEANGGNLHCTTGREFIAYTVETNRDKIHRVDRFIKELAAYQVFKPWEVKDNLSRLRLERTIRPPEVRIMELIHKAAYRKGLGYSLYSPKWMIGNHSSEMLTKFMKKNFVEASIVGTGVDHDQVKIFAERLTLPGGGASNRIRTIQPSKYHPGSELRKETGAELAYVAIAVEGASYNNHKDMVASALVHRALGSGARTKRGANLGGKISEAVSEDVEDKATVTTFSSNYSDSGLLGVFIAATPCAVNEVTKKSAEILLSAEFTDEDVKRAKSMLAADIAFATESDGGYVQEIGLQSLLTGNIATPSEVEALIKSVTASDMNNFVKNGKGKLTMASFGSIAYVPYLDQLNKPSDDD